MSESEFSPFGPGGFSLLHKGWGKFNSIKLEALLEEIEEALLVKENWNMVSGVAVMDSEDLLDVDVTEKSDLVRGRFLKGLLATTGNLCSGANQSLLEEVAECEHTKSGDKPADLTSLIACCVGLVFCSP